MGSTDSGFRGELNRDRPSSVLGKATPPARLFKALANEEVRRMVLETELDTDDIVSPREKGGRDTLGDGGAKLMLDPTRDLGGSGGSLYILSAGPAGGWCRVVQSNALNGESSSRAMM